MAHVVAIANQKGGVGKTTTAVNIAAFAAIAGKRTLLVDNDPQGNASSVLGQDLPGDVFGLYMGGKPVPTPIDGLHLAPAGRDLIHQETRLLGLGHRVLSELLAPLHADYDLVLIDCPPSLAALPANALAAANEVLIPLQCQYYAMEGLGQILAYLDTWREQGVAPSRWRVLLTMADPASGLAQQVEREVRGHLGKAVLPTAIPRDEALAAAPSHGQCICIYNPLGPGSLAYLAACKEFLDGI